MVHASIRSIPRRGDRLGRRTAGTIFLPFRRIPWVFLYRVYRFLLERLAYGYSALEYFFLLLPHCGDIRAAEYVYPLTFVSFGHQGLDLHMAAMRFSGKRCIAFVSDYRNFNRPLVRTFESVLTVRYVRHTRLAVFFLQSVLKYDEVRGMRIAVMRLFVRLVRSRTVVLTDCNTDDRPRIEGRYATEYMSLLHHSPPTLSILHPPEDAIAAFRSVLHSSHPRYADAWFVSLYLRRKYRGRPDVRDTDPRFYGVIITRVRELGGFVLCGGDYDPHVIFAGQEGVLGYDDFPCTRALCDLFFLSQPRFLVCTHSGPLVVATVFGVPSLVTNCAIFYQSGFRANSRVIYKKLRDVRSSRILGASETFAQPIVAYEEDRFARTGLAHIDNTEEEIAAGFEEMVALFLRGVPLQETEEDRLLLARFRGLLPAMCVARCSPARPTLHYLRTLAW